MKTGRISREHKEEYHILYLDKEIRAEVSGKYLFQTDTPADFPKVGDNVRFIYLEEEEKALIQERLERKTVLSRNAAGKRTEEQILAVNIDGIFIVMGLDLDYNPRRMERLITVSAQSGATPFVVLNKADICRDLPEKIKETEKIAKNVSVFAVSAETGEGIEKITEAMLPDHTYCLLGASGAGKSTLINRLMGTDIQKTREVRDADSKGRHTTTSRQLFRLPWGAYLIDTPGIREFRLWEGDAGIESEFPDIADLAQNCFFRDCTHTHEEKCAVLAAVQTGELDEKRFLNYRKMQNEIFAQNRRKEGANRQNAKRRFKEISKDIRRYYKIRNQTP